MVHVGVGNPGPEITAFDKALADRDVAPTTRRAYVGDALRFARWMTERSRRRFQPKSVTPIDVVGYREHLLKVAGHGPRSINRSLASLRQFFRTLKEEGHVGDVPTERLRGVRIVRATSPQALSAAEVHALLRAARTSGWKQGQLRNVTIVQLFVQTGLRLSELLHLRWEDLSVRAKSGILRVRAGKGLKERILPLNRTARKALADWKAALAPERARPHEHVFASKRDGALTARAIERLFTELAQRARLRDRKVTPHTLRHTFAAHYLASHPADLVGLAALLGHDSIATTAIYTKPTAESLAEKVEAVPLNAYE